MKKYILGCLVVSTLIFSGCSNKQAGSTAAGSSADSTNKSVSTSNISTDSAAVKNNFKPIKPGTLPQLTKEQKSQVNDKLKSAVSDVNNTLKSLQDPSDINLDSTN